MAPESHLALGATTLARTPVRTRPPATSRIWRSRSQRAGLTNLHVLDGGITAWQNAGGPVNQGPARWDLERQVRLVAGSLVLTGVLASIVAPRAKWLSAAIGAGLTTAALTNTCAMGRMLSKLPYNRDASTDLPTVIAELTGGSGA